MALLSFVGLLSLSLWGVNALSLLSSTMDLSLMGETPVIIIKIVLRYQRRCYLLVLLIARSIILAAW